MIPCTCMHLPEVRPWANMSCHIMTGSPKVLSCLLSCGHVVPCEARSREFMRAYDQPLNCATLEVPPKPLEFLPLTPSCNTSRCHTHHKRHPMTFSCTESLAPTSMTMTCRNINLWSCCILKNSEHFVFSV